MQHHQVDVYIMANRLRYWQIVTIGCETMPLSYSRNYCCHWFC